MQGFGVSTVRLYTDCEGMGVFSPQALNPKYLYLVVLNPKPETRQDLGHRLSSLVGYAGFREPRDRGLGFCGSG